MKEAVLSSSGVKANLDIGGKARNKNRTREELQRAILKLKIQEKKITIRGVAREIGVDASLIHHVYPEVAQEIRAINRKDDPISSDVWKRELMVAKSSMKQLRSELSQLKTDLAKAASINLQLEEHVAELNEKLTSFQRS